MSESIFSPYDYVKIGSSQLAVVRATCDCGRHVVVRPTYELVGGRIDKLSYEQTLPDSSPFVAEPGLRLVEAEQLSVIHSWNKAPVSERLHLHPPPIRLLLEYLSNRGIQIFSYGSRILPFSISKRVSDWDFVVDGGEATFLALGDATRQGLCRRLDASEIDLLIQHYSYYRRSLRAADLYTLLTRCLLFVAIGDVLVDFFTVNLLSGPLLAIPHRIIAFEPQIQGSLARTGGSSYGMPRNFSLVTDSLDVYQINHLSWLLGGLEGLAGRRVECSNVGVASDGSLWYSPWFSQFRLI